MSKAKVLQYLHVLEHVTSRCLAFGLRALHIFPEFRIDRSQIWSDHVNLLYSSGCTQPYEKQQREFWEEGTSKFLFFLWCGSWVYINIVFGHVSKFQVFKECSVLGITNYVIQSGQ